MNVEACEKTNHPQVGDIWQRQILGVYPYDVFGMNLLESLQYRGLTTPRPADQETSRIYTRLDRDEISGLIETEFQ